MNETGAVWKGIAVCFAIGAVLIFMGYSENDAPPKYDPDASYVRGPASGPGSGLPYRDAQPISGSTLNKNERSNGQVKIIIGAGFVLLGLFFIVAPLWPTRDIRDSKKTLDI